MRHNHYRQPERSKESTAWGVAFIVAAIILAIVGLSAGGCHSTPTAIQVLADAQVEHWREVRQKGAAQFEDEGRHIDLRAWAAAAAQIAEYLRDGELKPGAAFRLLDEEKVKP